jgi:hypothetical protein
MAVFPLACVRKPQQVFANAMKDLNGKELVSQTSAFPEAPQLHCSRCEFSDESGFPLTPATAIVT